MTRLDQDNFPCTWCIGAVPISVFSRGDNLCTSKGMKITCTAYIQGSIKCPSRIMCLFKGCFVSRTLRLDECVVQKEWFSCFYTVTDCSLKLLGYPEHCVYSERVRYRPNLYRPIKLLCFRPKLYRA